MNYLKLATSKKKIQVSFIANNDGRLLSPTTFAHNM